MGVSTTVGFPQFRREIFIAQCYAMLCNQLRNVVQSFFSRSVLTKQFSAIKSEFFSISTFTSAVSFKARGCLTK